MAESMLAILCHILRGEPIIQERLSKEREGTARPEEESSSTSGTAGTSVPPAAGGVVGEAATVSANGSAPGGSAEETTNSTTRREPQVNQAQLTQVPLEPLTQVITKDFTKETVVETTT